jgi:hypothetical protein
MWGRRISSLSLIIAILDISRSTDTSDMTLSDNSYEERRIQSLRLLNTVYDKVNGIADETAFVYSHLLAQDLGMNHSITLTLAHYLQGKNLLKISIQVHGLEYRLISMTEKGVTEVESARANKETPVEKYPLEQLV